MPGVLLAMPWSIDGDRLIKLFVYLIRITDSWWLQGIFLNDRLSDTDNNLYQLITV
jgi:hypothetical protein